MRQHSRGSGLSEIVLIGSADMVAKANGTVPCPGDAAHNPAGIVLAWRRGLKPGSYRIHAILTDNGIQFAEQLRNRNTATLYGY